MPLTPFHFGVGLLVKGVAPARVSLSAFVLSQVVIDFEPAYFIFVAKEWPVHRLAHTLPMATLIGIGVGVAVWSLGAFLRHRASLSAEPETALWPAVLGGGVGGLTHPLLDAIMHADVRPLSPFSAENPLLGVLTFAQLHLVCVAAGAVGIGLLVLRSWRRTSSVDPTEARPTDSE